MVDKIYKWNELDVPKKKSLLIGNGFSATVSRQFLYHSLVDEAELGADAKAFFDVFEEVNFETIMSVLTNVSISKEMILSEDPERVIAIYNEIKEKLIKAIEKVHPKLDEVGVEEKLGKIGEKLFEYDAIFTTNYDLLLYWISSSDINRGKLKKLKDFFWNDFSFGENFKGLWINDIGIYYLHGGLHIFSKKNGGVDKISTGNRKEHLASIEGYINKSEYPLFISEGKSSKKLEEIEQNNYLRFCYSKLKKNDSPLVVFGHGLDDRFDEHIIKAIGFSYSEKSKSNLFRQVKTILKPMDRIFISIFDKDSNVQNMKATASKINSQLLKVLPAGVEVVYFDAKSHPLSVE